MSDPVTACRVAIQALREKNREDAIEALRNYKTGDDLALLAGNTQGFLAAADFFEAALNEALKNDPDREEDDT